MSWIIRVCISSSSAFSLPTSLHWSSAWVTTLSAICPRSKCTWAYRNSLNLLWISGTLRCPDQQSPWCERGTDQCTNFLKCVSAEISSLSGFRLIHPRSVVFQKIRPSLGPSVAVVATFFISAALHLFEIRVMVVLLGLSIVSLIESRLERHFPKKPLELWLRCTTFVHLVFFGCIMQGYEEEPDGSYLNFVMERWLELGFISFKILLVECVLCVLLDLRDLWGKRSSNQK